MFIPSNNAFPFVGSNNRKTTLPSVDFSNPLSPTNPQVLPRLKAIPDISLSLDLQQETEQTAMDTLFEELKIGARLFSYDDLLENAPLLSGKLIRLKGKVTGKVENSSIVVFMNMTYTGDSWVDRAAVYYHDADDIANGEVITICGIIMGFYNLSKGRFIPAISAELIE